MDYDLSDRIEMMTSWYDFSLKDRENIFDNSKRICNYYLNSYGPMYKFFIGDDFYLTQYHGKDNGWFISKNGNEGKIDEYELIYRLKLPPVISIDMLIKLFVE